MGGSVGRWLLGEVMLDAGSVKARWVMFSTYWGKVQRGKGGQIFLEDGRLVGLCPCAR